MKKIILASASPRRSQILEGLNIPFEKRVSSIDEDRFIEKDPIKMVKTLSYEKAKSAILSEDEDAVIIGADTIVVYNNKILGKPNNEEEAFYYLEILSGNIHFVYTGISMIHPKSGIEYIDYCKTKVFMRDYKKHEIMAYIKTREPVDKAGAYAIQGFGAALINKIDGDYYNVIGLPISKLIEGMSFLNIDYFSTYLNK